MLDIRGTSVKNKVVAENEGRYTVTLTLEPEKTHVFELPENAFFGSVLFHEGSVLVSAIIGEEPSKIRVRRVLQCISPNGRVPIDAYYIGSISAERSVLLPDKSRTKILHVFEVY